MRNVLPLATSIALVGSLACGSAPEPKAPATPQGEVKPAPAQVATSATPAFDLSPVAEPADVVGVLRWSNPGATLSRIGACAGLPPALAQESGQLLATSLLRGLFGASADTKPLAALVALDAPVHLLAALDSGAKRGKPLAAISIGLSSLEQTQGALEGSASLTEVAPGLWKIGHKKPARSSCFLAASSGSTPARLLCGDRDRDLTALGPYLARTLPTLPPEARDLHGEIRFTPLSARYGGLAQQQLRGLPILAQSQLSIGEPKFDRALGDAARAIQDELATLIDDADKATLALAADDSACLSATAGLSLRGDSSWLAGTMTDRAVRVGGPPALYWRLPKDSDTAFFERGIDPARYSGILKTLRSLLEGWLDQGNVGKPADRKALADLLSPLTGKDTSSVSARGHAAPPAPAAKSATSSPPAGAKPSPLSEIEAALAGWIGWNLVGLDEPPAATIKYLKDLVAAYNRPALLGELRKQLGKDGARLLPAVKTVAAPKELGKSALALEMAFKDLPAPDAAAKPDAKPRTVSLTLHLLVMGEDNATWIAVGKDREALLKQLAVVKAGAPDANTLAARPGLESLKAGKLSTGGFMTLAPLTRAFENGLNVAAGAGAKSMPPEVQRLAGTLASLPHKGEGLILFTIQAEGGKAPRAEITLNLTKPAIEDLGAIILAGLKLAGTLSP
jgi:hypothetical protein